MSWSVSAIGKPGPVAAKVTEELNRFTCTDPEEGVKQAAAALLATCLAAQDPNTAVRVSASGHQSGSVGNRLSNNLKIDVEPVYGFVE
jgi:hypothetical protein